MSQPCTATMTVTNETSSLPWPAAAAPQTGHMHVEGLYERWGDDIWAYVRSMTSSDSDADDVFQQVFLKAHRGLPSFCGNDAKARSWLFTITINAVRDHHRRQRPQQDVASLPEPPALDHSPQALLEGRELAELVASAVGSLSPKLHEVWVLRQENELSFQEIAELLGEPRKRIMGRMYLALQTIRAACDRSLRHDD